MQRRINQYFCDIHIGHGNKFRTTIAQTSYKTDSNEVAGIGLFAKSANSIQLE